MKKATFALAATFAFGIATVANAATTDELKKQIEELEQQLVVQTIQPVCDMGDKIVLTKAAVNACTTDKKPRFNAKRTKLTNGRGGAEFNFILSNMDRFK